MALWDFTVGTVTLWVKCCLTTSAIDRLLVYTSTVLFLSSASSVLHLMGMSLIFLGILMCDTVNILHRNWWWKNIFVTSAKLIIILRGLRVAAYPLQNQWLTSMAEKSDKQTIYCHCDQLTVLCWLHCLVFLTHMVHVLCALRNSMKCCVYGRWSKECCRFYLSGNVGWVGSKSYLLEMFLSWFVSQQEGNPQQVKMNF